MKFLCSQCGACCRNISKLGLPHNGDGVCSYLNRETNKCSIYETRPDICRVDKMFENYFKPKMSKKEFYKINTKACHTLIDKDGLDESFKIDIEEYDR
jgi:Fe-S-cluster containining protein